MGKHDRRPYRFANELFQKMGVEMLKHHTVHRVIGICGRYGDRGAHQTTEVSRNVGSSWRCRDFSAASASFAI